MKGADGRKRAERRHAFMASQTADQHSLLRIGGTKCDEEDCIDDVDYYWNTSIQNGYSSRSVKPLKGVNIGYDYSSKTKASPSSEDLSNTNTQEKFEDILSNILFQVYPWCSIFAYFHAKFKRKNTSKIEKKYRQRLD
ncbi:hypothetical protein BDV3_003757 [Batrachochytrium dendrobatidis]